jgi:hypothetical protein
LRPKEVSTWIRSKKKEVVPSFKPEYGDRFIAWWKNLQPSWRTDTSDACFRLFRDVPTGETWQELRKGGKTGIILVIMGLSWWVKAQHMEHDASVWSVVDDLRWVIQQMDRDLPSLLVSPKRAHEQDEDDEGQRRKRYEFIIFWLLIMIINSLSYLADVYLNETSLRILP